MLPGMTQHWDKCFSISSAFKLVVCWWAPIRPQPPTWRIWTSFPSPFCSLTPCLLIRHDGQARGVPGGKHGEARPTLQSLQDEPAPQVWERRRAAALHGETGETHDTRDTIQTADCALLAVWETQSHQRRYDNKLNRHMKMSKQALWASLNRMCLFRNHTLCVSVPAHLWPTAILVILFITVISSPLRC